MGNTHQPLHVAYLVEIFTGNASVSAVWRSHDPYVALNELPTVSRTIAAVRQRWPVALYALHRS